MGWKTNPEYVYIGSLKDTDPTTITPGEPGSFGNPFVVKEYGRESCLDFFKSYFYDRISKDKAFREAVLGLAGKILVCYCKPLACHGDTYAIEADRLREEEDRKEKLLAEIADIPNWKKLEEERLEEARVWNLETRRLAKKAQQASESIKDYESCKAWREAYLNPVLRREEK